MPLCRGSRGNGLRFSLLLRTSCRLRSERVPWALLQSYEESAERLYLAGLMLGGAGDPATAGHLCGVAAECAVKAVLERAGIAIDRPSGFKVHIPELVQALLLNASTRHSATILNALPALSALATTYSIHTRYAADGCIDDAIFLGWLRDAGRVLLHCGFAP